MERADNYQIQARQAKELFLTYDQQELIRKLGLKADERYLYLTVLGSPYRICRASGDMERQTRDAWVDANSHGEVMTVLDLLCDSRPDRHLAGVWKNMASFGLLFHRGLLEDRRDPWAQRFQDRPQAFCRACEALGGQPLPIGDIAYSIELLDGLPIALQLWLGDEEFPPNLRYLWDENTLMYIRYETMYFALGMLLERIWAHMEGRAL